ncbi:HTH-type transcriptional regulator DmlR [BD1-7 clade bacterium]|uniref:HTH-type transcriptional regulator DmlR n=1 Tax=BD1-7 clade bacterium TaxID=2029982 RepID=A0A5S9NVP3_9GAMM|nr:HTH-type transcriptional regulator DmlR [BD1-7 clade bacterium]CAA0095483.1 HTH-type transcriptional regulator DmlR [BD1-7 clade bacterium]
MELSFEQLKSMTIFANVVEQGNFSKAAVELGLSRAVVSYHIKRLETRLQITLLDRSTRSVKLTEAGEAYYHHCRQICEHAKLADLQIRRLQNEPIGNLAITCPVNLGLALVVPILSHFRENYPKITLDIMLSDNVIDIDDQKLDLAIRGAAVTNPDLQAEHLSVLTTCLCGSPEYFRKHGRPSSAEDLQNHAWVIYSPGPANLTIKNARHTYSLVPEGPIKTNNAAARTAFVEAGHGLGRIPCYDATPKIQAGTLEKVMEDFEFPSIELYAVFPKSAEHCQLSILLRQFLASELQKRVGK